MALKLIQGKQITASLTGSFTGSFSGSFNGTSSFATQALSASNALTASFVNTLNQSVIINGNLSQGSLTETIGSFSHAEGFNTNSSGSYSHAEGYQSVAQGLYSHAEGGWTDNDIYFNDGGKAIGPGSHAEGIFTTSIGAGSHAEGYYTNSTGEVSHAEGQSTNSLGYASHAEGSGTNSSGDASHAEGLGTISSGLGSHAEGFSTISSGPYQHVQGQFNITSSAQSAFIVGNGTSDSNRSNLIFASGSQVQITGSLNVTQGITGSLFGTASFAVSSSRAVSSLFAATSSYSRNLQISGSINNVDYIDFNTQSVTTQPIPGRLSWNDTDGTLDIGLKGGKTTIQIGQEEVARVVNKTGGNLLEANYQVVRIRSVAEGGAQGGRLAVVLAQANNDDNSATTLGVVTENIDSNQEGFITLLGQVRSINTTGALQGETWIDGDILYLSATIPGHLTNIKPQAPQHTVIVGFVEYAHNNQGKLFIKIDNGYEIDELHNVKINTGSLTSGQLLIRSGSVWINSTQLTGSYGLTGSLNVTQGITGSLFGTASFAVSSSRAVSSSFATQATSASNALTASFTNISGLGGFVQGGNSFGTTALIGTNDNNALIFETSGSARLTISNTGNISAPIYFSPSGSTRKTIENTYIDLHPESNGFNILPFYANDIAYNTLRGGTFVGTPGPGSTVVTSTSQIESMFDGSPTYAIFSPPNLSGSYTASITFPQSFQYANTIGFSFGNTNWRAKDFTVEILVTGSYFLLDTVVNYPDANYNRTFNYQAQDVQGARITFSNFQSITTSGFRISDIFLLNYNGQLGKAVFLARDGGSLYKSLTITGSLTTTAGITGSLFGTASFVNIPGLGGFVQGGNSFGTTALIGTNDSQSLALETNSSERMRITPSGNVLINTTTNNGIDALQINGTVSILPATLSNQAITKTQLDATIQNENYVYQFHDFISNNGTQGLGFVSVNSGAVTYNPNLNLTPNNPGKVTINSSTTANSGLALRSAGNVIILKGQEVCNFIINPLTFANTTLRAGIHSSTSSGDANSGVYFEYSGNGVLTFKTANNDARTTSASLGTLLVNNWYKLRITVNSNATSVLAELFNNVGVLISSVTQTTNLPTTARFLNWALIATNSGTVATALVDVDFMDLKQYLIR